MSILRPVARRIGKRMQALAWTVCAAAALGSATDARLPQSNATGAEGQWSPEAILHLQPRARTRGQSVMDRSAGWRCQSTCDASGHVRQRCLMLEDPRLSGLAQSLDHLSQAQPALKSLSDLGLAEAYVSPTC